MAELTQTIDQTKFSEEKLKTDVVKWINNSKRHYYRRLADVDEYVRRYEAKRSIAGLMGWGEDPKKMPKNYPWDNASDVGIPIEAFTIEGLLPRFLKVCYGAKPIVWIKGNTDDDIAQAPTVQDALNFQVTKIMKIYRRQKITFKNLVMDGDAITKCVWEVEEKIINSVVYNVVGEITGEPLLDENGQQVTVKKDEEISDVHPQTGEPLIKSKEIISKPKKIYDNPKLYPRNVKQIVVPIDANTPFIEDLDWIADQYERTIDWLKRRIGDTEEGKFDERAVFELEQSVQQSPGAAYSPSYNYKKILVSEWHGKYDVNDDGLDEEIVVFVGTKDLTANMYDSIAVQNSKLLGWMITPYPRRPFFHYQIIPMDGSFYGKGVPEFLIGIRNLLDALFNQMVDRGSINNYPPLITPNNHDPDENPFGPGATFGSDNPGGYKVLELPKSEQIEFVKIEFLMALVQKLFGITDYSLGTESTIASNRTATGILTIVGEGNIKFDDMIRSLQDINEDLYDFIVQLDAEFLEDEMVFKLTGGPNPFKKIDKYGFKGSFDFEAAGNSVNINREIEQNRASVAYKTSIDSFGKNPSITDEVLRTVTGNFFRSIDMRNVKLPTDDELAQRRAQDMAQAIQILQQQQAEAAAKAQGGGTGGAATTPNLGQAVG